MFKYVRILVLLLLAGEFLFAQSADTEKIINEVKEQYAPDRRVAIYDVEAKNIDGKVVLEGETNLKEAHKVLVDKLSKAGIKMTDEVKVLPEEKLGDKIYGIVNLSVANMRSEPGHSAEMATQPLLGMPLKVYKSNRYWYYVQSPDGYLAWLDASGFVSVTREELDKWLEAEKLVFTEDYGHSYSKKDKNSQRVSDLVLGDLLKLKGEDGDFYFVEYPDGREAYVEKSSASLFDEWIDSREPTAENIIAKAKTFMGLPYLWGGTSPKGVDCSGFTKTVFQANGIILPRDASQQVHTGNQVTEVVDFDKLQPGDLLFFGRKALDGKKERITHVGIYIGDTEFIHSSGTVKINSFDKNRPNYSEYRYEGFIRARRVLDSINENGISTFDKHKFYNGEF